MKMSPMHDLGNEHGGIMKMLKVMEQVANKLRSDEPVDRKHLDKILEFLTNFADKCHHGKEENYLFPELIKDSSKKQLINEFLANHKEGRSYIKKIDNSINLLQSAHKEKILLADNIENYIRLLTEHIKKENVVFYEADKKLPQNIQKKLEENFEILENKIIGIGKHEEYHHLLEDLTQIYLPENTH